MKPKKKKKQTSSDVGYFSPFRTYCLALHNRDYLDAKFPSQYLDDEAQQTMPIPPFGGGDTAPPKKMTAPNT